MRRGFEDLVKIVREERLAQAAVAAFLVTLAAYAALILS